MTPTSPRSRARINDSGAIVRTATCATDPNADTTQDPAQHYFPRPETWANGNISEYAAAATPPNPFTLPSGFQMIANPGGTASPFYIDDAGGIYAAASAGWIESTDPVNYSIQIGGNGYTGLYRFDQGTANAASTPALQEGETKWDTNPHDGRSGDPGSPNYEAPPPWATYPYLYAGDPIPTFSPSNGMSLIPLGGSNGAIMLGTTSQLNNDGTITSGLGYANAGTINSLSDAVGFGGVNTLGEILYTSTVGGLKIANIQPGTASAIDPATGKPPTGIFPNGTLLNGIAGEWNSQHQIVNSTQFWEKGTVYQTSDLIGTNSGWSGFYPSGMMGKVINDSGCIAGTAIALDQNGNPITDANGNPISHGVMLLPANIKIAASPSNDTNYKTDGNGYIPINGGNINGSPYIMVGGQSTHFPTTPDCNATNLPSDDGQLVHLLTELPSSMGTGWQAQLSVQNNGRSRIQFWKDRRKQQQFMPGTPVAFASFPKDLYVEGTVPAAQENEIVLTLQVIIGSQTVNANSIKLTVTPVLTNYQAAFINTAAPFLYNTGFNSWSLTTGAGSRNISIDAEMKANNMTGQPQQIQTLSITSPNGVAVTIYAGDPATSAVVRTLKFDFAPSLGGKTLGSVHEFLTTRKAATR